MSYSVRKRTRKFESKWVSLSPDENSAAFSDSEDDSDDQERLRANKRDTRMLKAACETLKRIIERTPDVQVLSVANVQVGDGRITAVTHNLTQTSDIHEICQRITKEFGESVDVKYEETRITTTNGYAPIVNKQAVLFSISTDALLREWDISRSYRQTVAIAVLALLISLVISYTIYRSLEDYL